jgi:site-specific DNA recombinase
MRAILYARVSTEEQLEGWSVAAQIREFEAHCQQKDWENVGIYTEEGKSARSDSIDKRPQFRRLLGDCEKGIFDVVVVHSLDRWSRNLRVTLESFKQLADQRIAFSSITENIDYSTPEGKLFIAMLGAFAQYFSDSLAKHTSKGIKERVMNGLPNGDIPFGYRRHDNDDPAEQEGHVYIVPKEAEAVKKIFQYYAGGGWSLSRLAAWLNERGFRTRNKHQLKDGSGQTVTGPRPFSLYSVRWLLHNPFFIGKVSYHGQLFDGQHEPIIDGQLFNQVQQKLRQAKNRSRSVSPAFRIYLLKGIIRCIYCGYPLWCETSAKGYALYREKKGARSETTCPVCEKSISCKIIDEQMDEIIESLALEPSWKERIMAKISAFSEQVRILKERKRITDKLHRLVKTYVDGLVEEEEYESQRKLLQSNLETLVVPEADVAMKAGQLIENLGTIWEGATLAEKHKLLTTMLDAVYVDLLTSRMLVGLLPKPAFYRLFESLKREPNSKVIIFNPKEKENALNSTGRVLGLVETGENRTPRPREAAQNMLQA